MNLLRTINTIPDNELVTLAQSCEKIRSINTKKEENRKEYVNFYCQYHDLFKKFVYLREETFNDLDDGEIEKPAFNSQFVKLLRLRQEELGITKYLINDVKFAFILNIVHWLDNPELLDKKTEYKPRNKTTKRKKSSAKPKLKIISMNQDIITIELNNTSKEPINKIIVELSTGNQAELFITTRPGKRKSLRCTLKVA